MSNRYTRLNDKMFKIILFVISASSLCSAYKILVVFPIPTKSHIILGDGFVHTLLDAGHQVTYITPSAIKNASMNLRQIEVSSNYKLMQGDQILNIEKIINKKVDLLELLSVFKWMMSIANNTLMDENVQSLLHNTEEHFDAVIIEWMYSELYAGFASVFDCPMIWSSSMDPHYLVLSLIDDDPNLTYATDIYSSATPPYSLPQRIFNLYNYLEIKFKQWYVSSLQNEIFEKAYKTAAAQRNRNLPSLNEAKYNASLMFGNSHASAGQSIRLPQNYVPIAGYHIDPHVKPLPKDLLKILDEATNGVIYFSMGSILKGYQMPKQLKENILQMFGTLKQTVIWKFEENIPNLPKNLHVVQWAPQQSILAHPNCVLFITHGGLLSTLETLHFGVPIIGMPMFADQFINVNRAHEKGFAIRVDLNLETPVKLKAAIGDILSNPRYRTRVKELSLAYHDRVATPRAELVHWVEHVVRTRGAPHLRSLALLVPWYQKMYLDLIIILFLLLLIAIYATKFLFMSEGKGIGSVNEKKLR